MQHVTTGYRGLGLLLEINSDRILLVLFILAALAAVGIVELETAGSSFVQNSVPVVSAVV
ncbi:MAG: hypothetical protein ACE5DK_03435 [Paracoccaceae bacterium]